MQSEVEVDVRVAQMLKRMFLQYQESEQAREMPFQGFDANLQETKQHCPLKVNSFLLRRIQPVSYQRSEQGNKVNADPELSVLLQ